MKGVNKCEIFFTSYSSESHCAKFHQLEELSGVEIFIFPLFSFKN